MSKCVTCNETGTFFCCKCKKHFYFAHLTSAETHTHEPVMSHKKTRHYNKALQRKQVFTKNPRKQVAKVRILGMAK